MRLDNSGFSTDDRGVLGFSACVACAICIVDLNETAGCSPKDGTVQGCSGRPCGRGGAIVAHEEFKAVLARMQAARPAVQHGLSAFAATAR